MCSNFPEELLFTRCIVVELLKIGTVKINIPPGFSTRCISENPAMSSGTCSKTSVDVHTSKLASANVSF